MLEICCRSTQVCAAQKVASSAKGTPRVMFTQFASHRVVVLSPRLAKPIACGLWFSGFCGDCGLVARVWQVIAQAGMLPVVLVKRHFKQSA